MEQVLKDYESPPDPVAEFLRSRADEARCPLKTWQVPVADDMDRCLRDRFFPKILQELNERLVLGDLSQLLGVPVVSERIVPRDLRITGTSYWRLNRTDFLADLDLNASLAVEREGRDLPDSFSLCLSLWFCSEEGFGFEVRELHKAEDRPERSFRKLDRFLVPILREDEIESSAEELWENCLPEIRDPKDRTARMLAEALGLTVRELRLHGQNHVRSILFFREGSVSVQEESRPGEEVFPLPVNVRIEAGTILLNTAARTEDANLDILHECIHYEWHLLFYRLQKLLSTSPLEICYRSVRTSSGKRPDDPLYWMEHQARRGSLALLLPLNLMRGRAWRLYQQASACPSANGYLNHPGFRWDKVIRALADEYGVRRTTVRRRLSGLGHPAARGAVNFVDGRYITPFAFSAAHSARGTDTLVISRPAAADLYHRSPEFREIMGKGDFVYADGHICLNDPQYLRPTPEGARLTPWANAHADACCLRFEKVYLQDRQASWVLGSMNSSEEYNREYDRFLDRRLALSSRERAARREEFMRNLPNDFPDALRYLMEDRGSGRVTLEQLAERAMLSRKTIERYRSRRTEAYSPDAVVAICLALHLPPWLSRIMLEKARISVQSYGPKGYYGEILDCCFMDTLPQIQEYLRDAGYPELKLKED